MNESRLPAQHPLGMLNYEQMNPSVQAAVQRCQDFDLSRVQRRLAEHGLLPESWIDECVLEFRRYLILNLVQPKKQPMFSPYVDEVWHQTILFTQMYHELGQVIAGRYFHHEPLDGDDPSYALEADTAAFDEFRSTYEALFGPLPEVWTRHILD